MRQNTIAAGKTQGCQQSNSRFASFQGNSVPHSQLVELVQEGARRVLQAAIDTEVDEFLAPHSTRVDSQNRRQVVRNGHLPSCEILCGVGPLEVKQPPKWTPFARTSPKLSVSEPSRYSRTRMNRGSH